MYLLFQEKNNEFSIAQAVQAYGWHLQIVRETERRITR